MGWFPCSGKSYSKKQRKIKDPLSPIQLSSGTSLEIEYMLSHTWSSRRRLYHIREKFCSYIITILLVAHYLQRVRGQESCSFSKRKHLYVEWCPADVQLWGVWWLFQLLVFFFFFFLVGFLYALFVEFMPSCSIWMFWFSFSHMINKLKLCLVFLNLCMGD